MSKVTVKIYGQEYTISGERSEEEIREIASHVDSEMRAIGRLLSDPSSGSLAVLTAVNIAEECHGIREEMAGLKAENDKLTETVKYYVNMWEEAKKTSKQNRDSINDMKTKRKEYEEQIKELTAKCDEHESTFFELQMENIQLKSELETYKRTVE